MLLNTVIVIIAYLCGSVSSAVIICKLMHLDDPRHHGSQNPGATNVLRLHGKTPAVLTLTGDLLKGLLPVMLAHYLKMPDFIIALTALTAFSGHVFPVFFKFRGGKGVATLIGVLLGINWLLGLAFIFTWLMVAIIFHYSSLAALISALLTPLYTLLLLPSPEYLICILLMVVVLLWRHRSNIRNLIAGKEDKIGIGKI